MTTEIRPIEPDEFAAFRRVNDVAFGWQPSDEDIEADRPLLEADRTLAVYDAGRIVATAAACSFALTLPGLVSSEPEATAPTVPAAGVTGVGVLPTYRRRGLLRALMRRQLDDVRARGESLAVLTASESVIYGRFGYGLATSVIGVDIDPRHGAFGRPVEYPGHLTLLDHSATTELLPALYDRWRRRQPGALDRSDARWPYVARGAQAARRGQRALLCRV
jgi:predicted N-acetyltransferase YhbS